MTALVWFKRDLRCSDHAALSAALACGQPVCALAVLEPRWLAQAETHPRQVGWWLHAALALKQRLADRGITLDLVEGDLPEVLDRLQRERPITQRWTQLFSHEETGSGWTYDRDLAVAAWCRQHAVAWQELPQNGVVRRLKDRSGWARRWQARM
ncbi:deoxyribodipyrimidine photo-lyase, partial [Ideonella sp.]|uniref:deoxyribodipyrimidine photo-lyase n=1 Tax=Ideonella sp. TaxID=1929293 RepID=UPI003BB7E49C